MKNRCAFATILITLFFSGHSVAQNLIEADLAEWVPGGSGPTASFDEFSGSNERITMNGPHGTPVTVWKAASTATSPGSGMSGGWVHTGVELATDKTYRIVYWMHSTGTTICDNNGGVFAKPVAGGSNVDLLNIELGMSPTSWPSLYGDVLPSPDKWFLMVSYVYGRDETSFDLPGGLYDPDAYNPSSGVSPTPVASSRSFKFPDSHTILDVKVRNDLWDCQIGAIQYSYQPRIEEVNGQEPTIAELINPSGSSGGTTVWNTSGNDIDYIVGNVGIGTTAQANYRLAVDGTIHTREVKVDLVGWADYVFMEGYELPTLEEVQKHIQEKGHLINIPSAAEVEANGIELGEMNKLLLEKIEELTLYILKMDREIQELKREKEQ